MSPELSPMYANPPRTTLAGGALRSEAIHVFGRWGEDPAGTVAGPPDCSGMGRLSVSGSTAGCPRTALMAFAAGLDACAPPETTKPAEAGLCDIEPASPLPGAGVSGFHVQGFRPWPRSAVYSGPFFRRHLSCEEFSSSGYPWGPWVLAFIGEAGHEVMSITCGPCARFYGVPCFCAMGFASAAWRFTACSHCDELLTGCRRIWSVMPHTCCTSLQSLTT
jgi:hypothetical protein